MPNKRNRVAAGIHRDKYGYDVRVKVRGTQRTKRFSFDEALDTMQLWQAKAKAELFGQVVGGTLPTLPGRGTLEAEVPDYLSQIAGRTSYKSDRSHMKAWTVRLGTWPVSKITTRQVNEAYSDWQNDGVSNQTIIHRRRVLREMWRMLYKDAPSPVKDARSVPKPDPDPVNVPAAIINTVDKNFRALNLPLEYAVFRVLATTLQRAGQVNKTVPRDLDLKAGTWSVIGAKKNRRHIIYLNPDMIAAWKLFIAANAWGKVDTCRQADLMRKCGWPADVRPYNLRHSGAFAAIKRGADIGDVQGLLGHSDLETTRRYYGPLQEERQRRISALLTGRFDEKGTS